MVCSTRKNGNEAGRKGKGNMHKKGILVYNNGTRDARLTIAQRILDTIESHEAQICTAQALD
jgi:hypothetical protein